jgi:hypothetical protein
MTGSELIGKNRKLREWFAVSGIEDPARELHEARVALIKMLISNKREEEFLKSSGKDKKNAYLAFSTGQRSRLYYLLQRLFRGALDKHAWTG